MVLKEYLGQCSAFAPVHFLSASQPVFIGLAACPAGCSPVPVQVVLEDIDVGGLLHEVGQGIVVLNYPVAKEHTSVIMTKLP